MRKGIILSLAGAIILLFAQATAQTSIETPAGDPTEPLFRSHVQSRFEGDLTAIKSLRPAYTFWQHMFTIPDGSVAFGSAKDGRLLAVFPTGSRNWLRDARWEDPALASILDGQRLPVNLNQRRDKVAALLEPLSGSVVHNPTRGNFLAPNARRYGSFVEEWSSIYERFGVPGDIGLAQVILESGLSGTIRSPARAIGFCQWLQPNWNRLKRLAAPQVIEAYNQTTQAPYCAAYLTILATKYGSFIPALSEHHAGGVNVGRTVINGQRMGGRDVREQYLMGAELARELRDISLRRYRDLYRTYGTRSFHYAEMVFGNTFNVTNLKQSIPQEKIHAMRTTRAVSVAEIVKRTGLSTDEVRRYNPALQRQVPARGTIYLPAYIPEFGEDVSFWHQPASPDYATVLNDFVRLEMPIEQWDDPSSEPLMRSFRERFDATNTEEGAVMATVLAYAMEEAYGSRRGNILSEFRASASIQRLFERGLSEIQAARGQADAR